MSVGYSVTAINERLLGVVTAIGNAGVLRLLAGGVTVSSIALSNPCGTVSGGDLNFTPQTDPSAAATGDIDAAQIENSGGVIQIFGLTVGIPLSSADIIISNGLNSTLVTVGQSVQLISGVIHGS